MRLEKFKTSHFKRIKELELDFSKTKDNITVLAGQNESGKSSMLEALEAFYQERFSDDSIFLLKEENANKQTAEFRFDVEEKDISDFCDLIAGHVAADAVFWESLKKDLRSASVLKKLTFLVSGQETGTHIKDDEMINLCGFINAKYQGYTNSNQGEIGGEGAEEMGGNADSTDQDPGPEENVPNPILITEELKKEVLSALYRVAPSFVLFSDSKCDLLPDNIKLSDYVNGKGDGRAAVKNLETIFDVSFADIAKTDPLNRRALIESHNKNLSANFSDVFKQRVHNENKVFISYEIDTLSKRRAEELGRETTDIGEEFIFFSVQTSDGEPLPLRLRSKGLIWFLSFWLVLSSMKDERKVILIDEPDNSLHVNAQADLLGVLETISKNYGHQIVYATHSPFLIPTDRLHRVKLVYNDQDGGVGVQEISAGRIDTKNKEEALLPIAHAIGCAVSKNNAIFDTRNVIVEGLSDMYTYQVMGRILKEKDYHFLPGIGTVGDKLNSIIGMCLGYGLKWCLILDRDSDGDEDTGTQKKFEIIKEEVFGGDEVQTKTQVYRLEGVRDLEDMFSVEDIEMIAKRIDFQLSQKPKKKDNVAYIGKKNKVIFWTMFASGNFKASDFSEATKNNFKKVFVFIKTALSDTVI